MEEVFNQYDTCHEQFLGMPYDSKVNNNPFGDNTETTYEAHCIHCDKPIFTTLKPNYK